MGTYIATEGDHFEVIHNDRAFGGRRTPAFRVDGVSGAVHVSTSLVLNGVPVSPSGVDLVEDDFVPDPGQTDFTLSELPGGPVQMFVNGARQIYGDDFVVSGTAAIWLNVGFSLDTSDTVQFYYPH